jgi:hypothetical protein
VIYTSSVYSFRFVFISLSVPLPNDNLHLLEITCFNIRMLHQSEESTLRAGFDNQRGQEKTLKERFAHHLLAQAGIAQRLETNLQSTKDPAVVQEVHIKLQELHHESAMQRRDPLRDVQLNSREKQLDNALSFEGRISGIILETLGFIVSRLEADQDKGRALQDIKNRFSQVFNKLDQIEKLVHEQSQKSTDDRMLQNPLVQKELGPAHPEQESVSEGLQMVSIDTSKNLMEEPDEDWKAFAAMTNAEEEVERAPPTAQAASPFAAPTTPLPVQAATAEEAHVAPAVDPHASPVLEELAVVHNFHGSNGVTFHPIPIIPIIPIIPMLLPAATEQTMFQQPTEAWSLEPQVALRVGSPHSMAFTSFDPSGLREHSSLPRLTEAEDDRQPHAFFQTEASRIVPGVCPKCDYDFQMGDAISFGCGDYFHTDCLSTQTATFLQQREQCPQCKPCKYQCCNNYKNGKCPFGHLSISRRKKPRPPKAIREELRRIAATAELQQRPQQPEA